MQFEHSFGLVESLYTRCLSTLVTAQYNPSQSVTVHPVPKFRSCHKTIMVIPGSAHCYTFCIYIYIYIYIYIIYIYILLLLR